MKGVTGKISEPFREMLLFASIDTVDAPLMYLRILSDHWAFRTSLASSSLTATVYVPAVRPVIFKTGVSLPLIDPAFRLTSTPFTTTVKLSLGAWPHSVAYRGK